MSMTSWRVEIDSALKWHSETWADVEGHTLTDEALDTQFDDSWGAAEGAPFTLWTRSRVYFPWVYDGTEGVASVPRHPCSEATKHVGGQ